MLTRKIVWNNQVPAIMASQNEIRTDTAEVRREQQLRIGYRDVVGMRWIGTVNYRYGGALFSLSPPNIVHSRSPSERDKRPFFGRGSPPSSHSGNAQNAQCWPLKQDYLCKTVKLTH
jgi:hypothetical protein